MPSLDVIIFAGFLCIYLFIGFICRPKHNKIEDYRRGNDKISTAKIITTMVLGWTGGGFLALFATETLKNGLYFLLPNIGPSIAFILAGIFISPRISEFIGKSSIADVANDIWGVKIAFITALCYILLAIGILNIQLQYVSKIFEYFGISSSYALITSGIIITFYCIIANQKTAVFSDIIQFVSFSCFIPIIYFVIWHALSNGKIMWDILKNHPNFDLNQVFNLRNYKMYHMVGVFGLIMIPRLGPFVFQNISMSQNTKQSALAFKISGLIILSLQISIVALALLAISNNFNINPHDAVVYFLRNYTPYGLNIILTIGTMVIAMSVASFLINTSSNMLIQNILQPIIFKEIHNQRLVLIYFAMTAGLINIYLTLKFSQISELALFFFGIYTTIISIPIFFAIFGFRSSELSVLIGMGASIISMIIYQWKFAVPAMDFFIPGVFTNIVFLFGSHYILKQKGGWLGIKGKREFEEFKEEKRRERQRFIYSTLGVSFLEFCKQGLPTSAANISFFGVFGLVSIFLTQISLPHTIVFKYTSLLDFIYASTFILSTNLIFYPIWPQILKKTRVLSIIWLLSVLYISIIIPAISAFISNFLPMQMIMALINFIAIFVMLKWNVTIFLILIGMLIASSYLYCFVDGINVENLQLQMSYLLLFLSGALISFLKPYKGTEKNQEVCSEVTQKLQDISEQTLNLLILKQDILNNLNQEIQTPIENIGAGAVTLNQNKNNLEKQNRDSAELVYKEYKKLQTYVNKLVDISQFDAGNVTLNYQDVNFEELVENVLNRCKCCELTNPNVSLKINNQAKYLITTCDPNKIFQCLEYLIKNAIHFTTQGKIIILLENQTTILNGTMAHMIKCSITDEGIGIPENELEYIFGAFTKSSYTENSNKGLGLALCQRIIELHNGKIWAENNKTKPGATFTFMIPRRPILS